MIAFWIKLSVLVSILDVASSKTKILGSFTIALAKDINCLSPTDNFDPPSPTNESYLSSNLSINSSAATVLRAWIISSSVASNLPYLTLSLIEPLNNCGVCKT